MLHVTIILLLYGHIKEKYHVSYIESLMSRPGTSVHGRVAISSNVIDSSLCSSLPAGQVNKLLIILKLFISYTMLISKPFCTLGSIEGNSQV